jgi:hypothetical protein
LFGIDDPFFINLMIDLIKIVLLGFVIADHFGYSNEEDIE